MRRKALHGDIVEDVHATLNGYVGVHDLRGTGAIPIELVSLLVASLVDSEVELCMRKVKITGLRWKWARVQGEIRITNDYRTLRKPTGKETVWYVT